MGPSGGSNGGICSCEQHSWAWVMLRISPSRQLGLGLPSFLPPSLLFLPSSFPFSFPHPSSFLSFFLLLFSFLFDNFKQYVFFYHILSQLQLLPDPTPPPNFMFFPFQKWKERGNPLERHAEDQPLSTEPVLTCK